MLILEPWWKFKKDKREPVKLRLINTLKTCLDIRISSSGLFKIRISFEGDLAAHISFRFSSSMAKALKQRSE